MQAHICPLSLRPRCAANASDRQTRRSTVRRFQASGSAFPHSRASTAKYSCSRRRITRDYKTDRYESMINVALATAAAPSYFRPLEHDGYTLVDGGVWANNPVMLAVIEALTCYDVSREQIDVLSLGCGDDKYVVSGARSPMAVSGIGRRSWEAPCVCSRSQRQIRHGFCLVHHLLFALTRPHLNRSFAWTIGSAQCKNCCRLRDVP